jgi:hypothetical protein
LLQGRLRKIPPFGDLVKRIKISSFRLHLIKKKQEEEEMRFQKRTTTYSKASKNPTLLPILPLVPNTLPAEDVDKTKLLVYTLQVRAGVDRPTYKKFMRTFNEGTPQDWMDVLDGLQEIWRQNGTDDPQDRTATVLTILRGDSRTAFETALEDAMVDPDPLVVAPLVMTLAHIETSLRAVSDIVFPFRALETQKQWMTRYMKKPYDLSIKKMAAALSRINNYLPLFPNGTIDSKFSDSEIVSLLEFSLPNSWRNAMDLKGFVPSENTKKALVDQCERIERNEVPVQKEKGEQQDNNKNNKKVNFAKSQNDNKKNGSASVRTTDGMFNCSKCGPNPTHNDDRCFVLKRLAREAAQGTSGNGSGKAQAKPYSKRTFRKEVNALARRAGKHDVLELMSTAVKREQIKSDKRDKKTKKKAKSKPEPMSDTTGSDSEGSINNLEVAIPRKRNKTIKINSRAEVVDIEDSSDEENNDATSEEAAFLRAIDREERKQQKAAASDMDEDSN